MSSDQTMQERWIRGRDAEAFAELVSRHANMVYGTCLRVLGNATEAEDAAQECFIALASEKRVVRSSVGAWLHTVAVHLSLNRIRTDRRRRTRDARFVSEHGEFSEQEWDDVKPHLDRAVAALPDRFRVPVVQRFLEGRTHEAIARDLGLSRSTVQYRIEKGVERIRGLLKRRGITSMASALSGALLARTSEAAPSSLIAALGERAIAGFAASPALSLSPFSAPKAVLAGGLVMSKKAVVISICAVLAIAAFLAAHPVRQWLSPNAAHEDEDASVASIAQSRENADASHPDHSSSAERSGIETPVGLAGSPGGEAPVLTVASRADGDGQTGEASGQTRPGAEGLSRPASISGIVADEAAYPVANARVRLEIMGTAGMVFASYETRTDAHGCYALSGIQVSGSGLASASAPGFTTHLRPVGALPEGSVKAGVDFVLSPGEHAIRGAVRGEDGRTIPDARIVLLNAGYETPGQVKQTRKFNHLSLAFSGSDGAFELFAPAPGLCDIKAEKSGYAPKAFFGIATGTEDAVLVLGEDTGAIAGTVSLADGRLAMGYPVVVQGVVHAGGLDGGSGVKHFNLQLDLAVTGSLGAYRFDGLSPNCVYNVAVLPMDAEERMLKGIQGRGEILDPAVLAAVPFVAVEPNAVSEVDLVIGSQGHVIGRVTCASTGGPLQGIEVSAVNALGLRSHTRTDTEGMYRVDVETSKGTSVTLRACYKHTHGRMPAVDGTQTIELSPGDERRVDFSIAAPLTIPIRAVDQTGQPLPGLFAGVGEIREGGKWNYTWPDMGTTHENGRMACHDLSPEGSYFVWLIHAQHAALPWTQRYFDFILAKSEAIMSEPGTGLPEVVLVVTEMGGLEGHVVGPAGEPLRGARLSFSVPGQDGECIGCRARTDETGYFAALRAFPPGRYAGLEITAEVEGTSCHVVLNEIEVVCDAVADLGVVSMGPLSGGT